MKPSTVKPTQSLPEKEHPVPRKDYGPDHQYGPEREDIFPEIEVTNEIPVPLPISRPGEVKKAG